MRWWRYRLLKWRIVMCRGQLLEAVCERGAGGDGDGEVGGGRVLDPGQRRAVGCRAQRHRLRRRPDVPQIAVGAGGRRRRQGLPGCGDVADQVGVGEAEPGQRERGGDRPQEEEEVR